MAKKTGTVIATLPLDKVGNSTVDMKTYIYYVSSGTKHAGSKIVKPTVYRMKRKGTRKTSTYKPSERGAVSKENKRKFSEPVLEIPLEKYNAGHIIVVNKEGDVVDYGPRHPDFKSAVDIKSTNESKMKKDNPKFSGWMDFDEAKRWHEQERTPTAIEMDETEANQNTYEPVVIGGKRKVLRSWQDQPGSMDWIGIDDINTQRGQTPWRQIEFPRDKIAPFLKHVLKEKYRPKKDTIKASWKNNETKEYVVVVSHEGKTFSTIFYTDKLYWVEEIVNAPSLAKAMNAAKKHVQESLPGGVFKPRKKK